MAHCCKKVDLARSRWHQLPKLSSGCVLLFILPIDAFASGLPAGLALKFDAAMRTNVRVKQANAGVGNSHTLSIGEPARLVPASSLNLPAGFRVPPDQASAALISTRAANPPTPPSPPQPPVVATVPPTISPESASVAKRPKGPHRDALIGDGAAEEEPVLLRGQGPGDSAGQRFISVEYLADVSQQQDGRREADQSAAIQLRRETENWGEWFLDAAGARAAESRAASLLGRRSGGRATLYHNAFPLTERWTADTALGVLRNPLNPLVSNSYRFSLPSPLYAGLSTQIGDGSRDFRFAVGEIGVLRGLSGSAFDTTSGQFVSAGANVLVDQYWSGGVQAIHVRDVPTVADHSSVAATIQHQLPGLEGNWSLHALVDSKSRLGGWGDAELNWGQSRHRVGIYQLDPNLLWADGQIANDQRGAYWRFDQRGLRRSLFGGISISETNIERVATRGGQKSVDGFVGITMRLSRVLSVGSTVSLQSIEPHVAEAEKRSIASGNAFISISGPLGASRLDASRYLVRPEIESREFVDSVGLSHDWPMANGYAVGSSLNASREVNALQITRRQSVNLTLRSPTTSTFHWDVALALARVDSVRGAEKNINASVSSYWQISPNWQASTQLIWNTIDTAPPLPGVLAAGFKHEKRLLFTLRYEQASGTPFAIPGTTRQGQIGTGRISGLVFFDENNDGIRQANERGASNVTVFLDGRLPATTDSTGRYSFASVPVGAHTLLLLPDSLPLPWTLEDEKGFKTSVPLRGQVIQDFPLIRLRP